MAEQSKGETKAGSKAPARQEQPRSLPLADRGIKTAEDFANVFSALVGDILAGRITASIGNAACNAGGKLLKVNEMQQKYGRMAGTPDVRRKVLTLTS